MIYQTHQRFSLWHFQILAQSLESCHCHQLFLTSSYETATQVIYFVVSLGPSTSTRTKINFNFMRRICMCKKRLPGKAGKWIILCCSSLDLQTLWIYTNMFSPVLYMRAQHSSKGLLGIIHQKHKNMSYAWGLLGNRILVSWYN